MPEMGRKAGVGVGLGAVIVILLVAALLFGGIKFSTSTVTNTSNNYFTTEGNFHVWNLRWNVTALQFDAPVFITPVAVVTDYLNAQNVTYHDINDGHRLFQYNSFFTTTGQFDPTWTVNGVFSVWENGTSTWYVVGQDGSILQTVTYSIGTISQFTISPNGQYIAVQIQDTCCPFHGRLYLYVGS